MKNRIPVVFTLQALLLFTLGLFLTIEPKAQLYKIQQAKPQNRLSEFERILTLYKINNPKLTTVFQDSVLQWAKKKGDTKLLNLIKVNDIYFKSQEINNDSARLTYVRKQFEPLLNTGDKEMLGWYYLRLCVALDPIKYPEKTTIYLVYAENIFNEIGFNRLYSTTNVAQNIGSTYLVWQNYSAAVHYYQIALQDTIDQYRRRFLLNNLGVCYLKLKNYPKALETFGKLMQIESANPDKTYYAIGSGNYGNTLRLLSRYKEALPYLYTDVSINEKNVPENTAITYLYIANCLMQLDSSLSKAYSYIKRSEKFITDFHWGSYAENYYLNMSLYYKKMGQYNKASKYQDSLIHLRDSASQIYDAKVLLASTLKANAEKN